MTDWTMSDIARKLGYSRQYIYHLAQTGALFGVEPTGWKTPLWNDDAVSEIISGREAHIASRKEARKARKKDLHGTCNCYNAGCRCSPCKEANTLRARAYREGRKASQP